MLKLFYRVLLLLIVMLSATILYQKHTYAYHTLVRIDPVPHTRELIKEEKYIDAYDYLSYFMTFEYVYNDPEAKKLLEEITQKRSSLEYRSQKVAEGIRTGKSDEVWGQASAIGSDFFLIGDLRDLYLEGEHYYKDEEVDRVIVALSTIGLVASASTLFSLGSGAVAKSGISLLKLAHKSKAIPLWLNTYLLKHAKRIRNTKHITSLKPLFETLHTLQKRVGLTDTLKLLSRTTSFKELKGVTKLTQHYGKQTPMLLQLSDKRLLSQGARLKGMNTRSIELASSYGVNGFVHLIKGGEKHFLKTTKRMKAYGKTGYKGELWKIILWIMKNVSDTLLMMIMGIASLLLLPFGRLVKRVSSHPRRS
jgi:hypothetical protein